MPKHSLKKALLGYKRAIDLARVIFFLIGFYFPFTISGILLLFLLMEIYLEVVAYQNNYYFFLKPTSFRTGEIVVVYNNHYPPTEFKRRFITSLFKDTLLTLLMIVTLSQARCHLSYFDQINCYRFQDTYHWFKATIPFLSHV